MDGSIKCSYEGCTETIKDHAWGKIKADGWFLQKDRTAFCPQHVPSWVASWRKRKKAASEEHP